MKKLLLVLMLIKTTGLLQAQGIGIGTTSPHNSALLDITSTNKGILFPRMTTVQREAITSPAKGLIVFDTNTNHPWFYNGTQWSSLAAGGGSGVFAANGIVIHNTAGNAFVFGGNSLPANGQDASLSGIIFDRFKRTLRAGELSSSKNWSQDSSGFYSVAFGLNSKAKGNSSLAVGEEAQSTGEYSFASGYKSEAAGRYSVASGSFSQASGWGSNAMGFFTKALASYSFATGNGTEATGLSAFAGGHNSVASGVASVAIGWGDTASGYGSTAFGAKNKATGGYSLAANVENNAVGDYAMATGFKTTASGISSVALNFSSIASGSSSFATGTQTTASGSSSASFGWQTLASGETCFSIGSASEAKGNYSFASGKGTSSLAYLGFTAGEGTTAGASNMIAMGRYNRLGNAANSYIWVETDPLFALGNGVSDVARSNAFTVLKNGRTGIGNVIPASQLHLATGPNDWTRHIRLDNNTSTNSFGVMLYDGDMKFRTFDAPASFIFRNSNNITTATLSSSGALTISGALAQNSDARLKTNITRLPSALPLLLQLTGYQYYWKDAWRGKDQQTGLLAQEVEQLMPELVAEDENGTKSVNYSGMVPYLLEGLKSLYRENEDLKARLERLEKLVASK